MTEVGSKLTLNKDERHVLIKTMVTHLLDQSDGELRRLFDINLRELTEVTNTLVTICWNALQATWEALKSEPQLVQRGILRTEILKALGEIELALKRMDKDTREKPAIIEKVKMIAQLYKAHRIKSGKRPAALPIETPPASVAAKRPRPNVEVGHAGHFIPGPPFIFHLEKDQIVFALERELGRGAFATAVKCSVKDENFPREEYVAKLMHNGDRGVSPDALAAMEATRLTVTHRGIVSPLGIVRDEEKPIIIYHFWNGGNLASWIWQSKATGKDLPPRDLVSISRDIGDVDKVRKNIFQIISALLYTIDFIHSRGILHNDLHQRNVFLHFSKNSNAVYLGIGDWGKSTRINTYQSAVRLPDKTPETAKSYRQMYPWMAPECFSQTPPKYTTAQDIYSTCYLIKRLLSMLRLEPRDPANKFVSRITKYADQGMNDNPSVRPVAYELLDAVSGAQAYGVILDRNSGLRPFDE